MTAEQSNIECIMFADDLSGKNKVSPQNMIAALKRGVALASRKIAGSQTELGQKD